LARFRSVVKDAYTELSEGHFGTRLNKEEMLRNLRGFVFPHEIGAEANGSIVVDLINELKDLTWMKNKTQKIKDIGQDLVKGNYLALIHFLNAFGFFFRQ